MAKTNKYRAKPTKRGEIRFDSKLEARYYDQLKQRVADGEVDWFLRQCPFHLPGGTKYVVDFLEFHNDGTVHAVDVKGMETTLFKTKKREVEAIYPIEIEVWR